MMIIKKAEKQDVPAILKLIKNLIEFHRRLDLYYKKFSQYRGLRNHILNSLKDKNKIVLVAENRGRTIAYLIGAVEAAPFYSSQKKIGVVNDVCVDEKFRRRGILKKIFKKALAWFRQKSVRVIELSVDIRNRPALTAWKKMKFYEYKLKMKRDL
jgi:GNAT superfamily N-acetyltransferase